MVVPKVEKEAPSAPAAVETAIFAGGCFWCMEAVFEVQKGVKSATSGYTGGTVPHPTYKQVCTGQTGHAEAVKVEFDPTLISYRALLDLFWAAHDPTQLNRQGNDVGTQYRSAIFYHSEAQKKEAETSRAAQAQLHAGGDPIVTQIEKAGPFYSAEDYHQDYYRNNTRQPYCRAVIRPKLLKLGIEP